MTSAMLQELAAARGALTLSICILCDPAAAARARGLARAFGLG